MVDNTGYPGTRQHQVLLTAIAAYYRTDVRILAVSLFGSLVRGNWDEYSDLDLDVVTADEAQVEVMEEVRQLCAALADSGQTGAIIAADGTEAADVVFSSLLQFSIRYHPLATTSPNIVDSLRVVAGRLDRETIARVGRANRRPGGPSLAGWLDRAVRDVTVADVAVRRGQVWLAVEMLHQVRRSLMQLYTLAHDGGRPLQSFQVEAADEWQARLGGTLPQFSLASVQHALENCLEILEVDLGPLTSGKIELSAVQRRVLAKVRARQSR